MECRGVMATPSEWHGEVIELRGRGPQGRPPVSLLVEVKAGCNVSLAAPSKPYHRYCGRSNGRLSVQEGNSRGNVFIVEGGPPERFRFRSVISSNVDSSRPLYLGVAADGRLDCTDRESGANELYTEFDVIVLSRLEEPAVASRPPLAGWQKRRFVSEGYLVVEQVVAQAVTDKCQALLMHHLGTPGSLHAGGTQPGMGKLGGKLTQAPEVQALITSEVRIVLEELLGINKVAGLPPYNASSFNTDNSRLKVLSTPFPTAQIALRFPEIMPAGDSPPDLSRSGSCFCMIGNIKSYCNITCSVAYRWFPARENT